MRFSSRPLAAVLLALAALPVSAKDLTVSAAASLKDAFQEIAAQYQRQHPGVEVRLNTAGSGALVQQLKQGAPVDVLATADQASMDEANKNKSIDPASRKTFVRNDLVMVVPKNSNIRLQKLSDLQQSAIRRIALSNPDSVPVGRYSKQALTKAGLFEAVKPKLITTQNVRQSLDYVARGEVDAGFVYRTDAALMPDKVSITAAVPLDTPVSYPIAVAVHSSDKAEARRFVDFVLSPAGRKVLDKYGFSRP